MFTLIVFVAAIACAVAEPAFLFGRDLPLLPSHPVVSPVTLPLRHDIPIVPTLPLYTTGLKTQYYDRDAIGQARYGHIEPGQSHHAVQDAFGNKIGGFSYYDSEGKLVQTSYIADSAGYRVSTNQHLVNTLVAPLTIEDTPEVKAAKIEHLKEIEKVKLRSKRDVIVTPGHISSVLPTIPHIEYRFATPHALPTTHTKPVLKKDGFLEDTPEVKFAKENHLFQVETAKIRNSLTPPYPFVRYAPFDYRIVNPVFHY